jgi:protein-tyrosine phosphatase
MTPRDAVVQVRSMPDAPARHLDLQGASNFRDLGGYSARDGRSLRWRRMFRSNHLGHLTAADVDIVRGLGVRSAFDFRGIEERAGAACGLQEIVVHSLPIEPTVVAALRAELVAGRLTAPLARDIMCESYRNYVRHNTHSFRALFEHLVQDRAPLVIHCTAGKDRTGFACALILHALDVPDEVIAADYLLTNRFYRRDPASATDLPDDVREAIGTVDASFLAAGFDAVRAEYGDLETYFRDGLNVGARERAELKTRYLES